VIRILIADDEPLARRALVRMLRDHDDVKVVAECEEGDSALAAIDQLQPDLVFLDIRMPGLDGLGVAGRLFRKFSGSVVFVTAHDSHALEAFDLNALDYLLKPFRSEVLLGAIGFALERSGAVLSREAGARTVRDCYAFLSAREREVMELVASGWLNKQIGAALGITEITVKVHRAKMMRKMKAMSLPDLVIRARTLGLKHVPMPNGTFFRSLESYAGTRNHLSQAHAGT